MPHVKCASFPDAVSAWTSRKSVWWPVAIAVMTASMYNCLSAVVSVPHALRTRGPHAVAGVGLGVGLGVTVGVGEAVVGSDVVDSGVGATVGATVVGSGVGATVVGSGVGATVVGTGVGTAVVGSGLGASVVGSGVVSPCAIAECAPIAAHRTSTVAIHVAARLARALRRDDFIVMLAATGASDWFHDALGGRCRANAQASEWRYSDAASCRERESRRCAMTTGRRTTWSSGSNSNARAHEQPQCKEAVDAPFGGDALEVERSTARG